MTVQNTDGAQYQSDGTTHISDCQCDFCKAIYEQDRIESTEDLDSSDEVN